MAPLLVLHLPSRLIAHLLDALRTLHRAARQTSLGLVPDIILATAHLHSHLQDKNLDSLVNLRMEAGDQTTAHILLLLLEDQTTARILLLLPVVPGSQVQMPHRRNSLEPDRILAIHPRGAIMEVRLGPTEGTGIDEELVCKQIFAFDGKI